ncbi:hypothetical protein HCN51_36995 [Nonomuraea sp. FMUSA5-5]|uniref:DUF4349 domain-containing protein n=1 Tax=Nonomuraea composti TaxID=2720023 RepID=A0ABX1BI59_9ACTN|nr:hypothetical protein [Nonomuraea sp. FMUSA5-5]NJP94971.1 hypothetical protein [Nonomuraea sp. FMUSA5-5]
MRAGWVALVLAVGVAGCSSPAWNDRDYELKAAASAETVGSTVEAVRLAVGGGERLTRPYLKVVLTNAAGQVQSVNDQFGGVQPPSERAEKLGERLLEVTERAEKEISGLLVEVRRDRVADPAAAVRRLAGLGETLRGFQEEHE